MRHQGIHRGSMINKLTIGVTTVCLLGVLILLFSAAFRLLQRADFAISAGSR
ncbi:hypothetical protein T02_1721 [Trichinella nativa]|uniref:Uncharacterized protein n=1 Tax=Trichinella nativa TaxID=6335 RepID=A0A0V1KIN3_9BILA|nr:hypothetical protein T02_1721 [Trichinella nativa]